MNYRQLRYFTVVARTLNFSKAAEELYVSQPAVSKDIAQLEKDLGAKLFIRTNRNLALTRAGMVLLEEADQIFAREPEIYRKVREAAHGWEGSLRIGFMGTVAAYRIPLLLKELSQDYPRITTTTQRLNWLRLQRAVEHGELDVGFKVTMDDDEDSPLLAKQELGRSHLAAVVPITHSLASRSEVHLSELRNERFILLSRDESPIPYDYTMRLCRKAGFTPKVTAVYPLVETVLMMVQGGYGIALLSPLAPAEGLKGISFVRIEGAPAISLTMVWKKHSTNPAIPLLVERAKKLDWGGRSSSEA